MSNPWKFLINSDLFVLSSLWEGFGNVIVEAMYLGIPVVSSDCESGPSEILNGGELGHLFKVGDDVQLSEIITSSLSEKERYLDIVNSAKRKSEEYSIETITEQYEAVFRGIIL
jgi:glycosyltransferase involved in cell wall biosynthesis